MAQESPCLPHYCPFSIDMSHTFHLGSKDWNSDPHCCVVSALPTESSAQPPTITFILRSQRTMFCSVSPRNDAYYFWACFRGKRKEMSPASCKNPWTCKAELIKEGRCRNEYWLSIPWRIPILRLFLYLFGVCVCVCVCVCVYMDVHTSAGNWTRLHCACWTSAAPMRWSPSSTLRFCYLLHLVGEQDSSPLTSLSPRYYPLETLHSALLFVFLFTGAGFGHNIQLGSQVVYNLNCPPSTCL
jgi:hypothetical protein